MSDTHYVVDDETRPPAVDPGKEPGEGGEPPVTQENNGQTHEGTNAELSEAENRAWNMGWRPEEEFRGPPEKFVSAEAFIKRTETEAPLMRKQFRTYDEKLGQQTSEIRSMKETLKDSQQAVRAMPKLLKTS